MRFTLFILFFLTKLCFAQKIDPNQLRGLVGQGTKVLVNDNSGNISFGDVPIILPSTRIAFGNGTGLTSDANLTYAASVLSSPQLRVGKPYAQGNKWSTIIDNKISFYDYNAGGVYVAELEQDLFSIKATEFKSPVFRIDEIWSNSNYKVAKVLNNQFRIGGFGYSGTPLMVKGGQASWYYPIIDVRSETNNELFKISTDYPSQLPRVYIGQSTSHQYALNITGTAYVDTLIVKGTKLLTSQAYSTANEGETFVYDHNAGGHTSKLLTKANVVGLNNVDNTSDANKPISTAVQTALNGKQNTLSNANASTSGILTSTDWNTFNGKQNALPNANASTSGILTSTDWANFNNKLSTNLYLADGTLSANRIINSGGFSLVYQGNAPLFHINSTASNTSPNLRLTRNNGGTGNVYDITQTANQVSHTINNSSANHAFFGNTTLFGYIGNAGFTASSQVANYPAYNFVGALQTGHDGTPTEITMKIGGVTRGVLNSDNDLTLGNVTSNFYAKTNYDVWNGSTIERMSIGGYGGTSMLFNIPTSRKYEFRANNAEIANISSTGIALTGSNQTVSGLKTSGATGNEAISETQASANYEKKTLRGSVTPTGTLNSTTNTYTTTITVTGAAVGDVCQHEWQTPDIVSIIATKAMVTSANTVTVWLQYTGLTGSYALGSSPFKVIVFK